MRVVASILGLLIAFCVIAHTADAAPRDDFPSCYSMLDRADLANKPAQRELFVIVDQTVPMNVALKRSVHRKVHRFLKPGDRFTLLTFSAFAKDRYASMPLTGKLDYPLDDDTRYRTSIPALKKFDHCMKEQKAYVGHKIDNNLKAALNNASDDLPKTELAGSLARFGRTVIGPSNAQTTVLIVSDMLENSDAASFYHHGRVTPIDQSKALKAVAAAGFISDWHDARVYVIGAGLVPGGGYRSGGMLRSLEDFWTQYFKRSDAVLKGWGQPDLMTELD